MPDDPPTPIRPLVGVIMGSRSDWETMQFASETLTRLGVPHEVEVVSAHRTPDQLFDYAEAAEPRGLEVLIDHDGRCNEHEKVGFISQFAIASEGEAHYGEISQNGNLCVRF